MTLNAPIELILETRKLEMCAKLYDEVGSWSSSIGQSSVTFDFYEQAGASKDYQLVAFENSKVACQGLPFCIDWLAARYTLTAGVDIFDEVPTTNTVATDFFVFDPYQLVFTVSGSVAYLRNGQPYSGPLTVTLCLDGNMCESFTLDYFNCVDTFYWSPVPVTSNEITISEPYSNAELVFNEERLVALNFDW